MNLFCPPWHRLWLLFLGLLLTVTACSAAGASTPAPTPKSTASPTYPSPSPFWTLPPSATPEPTPEPYDFSQPVPEGDTVEEDWFSDALFLGDSRTDGLRLYGGIQGADYICYKGLTSFDYFSKQCIRWGGKTGTAQQAMESGQWGKIYIMLGLNELGYSAEDFAAAFEALLDDVLVLQPQATLYIQSVVPINPQKAKEKSQPYYVTNEKVTQFNAELTRICQERALYFLNVSEGLTDETGILPYDSATDGVHFTKSWYRRWADYLRTHTADPNPKEVPSDETPEPDPTPRPAFPPAVPAAELV